MTQKDIENRIIEFIKKSPIGVTSSEIARYLGISRITITKYLAIFKEKAIIDFKKFGMAKLWFIPVNLNKELFLSKIITYLASNIHKGEKEESLNKAGIKVSDYIFKIYSNQYRVEKLNRDQTKDVIIDAFKKIGGYIKVEEDITEKITFVVTRSPFLEDSSDTFIMSKIISGMIGGLLSKSMGYCKVCLKPVESKKGLYKLIVYLDKTSQSESEKGIEYFQKE